MSLWCSWDRLVKGKAKQDGFGLFIDKEGRNARGSIRKFDQVAFALDGKPPPPKGLRRPETAFTHQRLYRRQRASASVDPGLPAEARRAMAGGPNGI